ncbi:MAG: glycosyltransferase [Deltaproteobacteria bacterium]|nr:glycosyltransferase [Deltaproteobacteria bacterium]
MSRTHSILHCLAYPLWTGPAEPVMRLARAQLDAGHEVALALDRLRDGDLVGKAAEWGVPLFDGLSLSVKAGPILNMRDILAFKRLFADGRFEFIHCHRSHDHTLAALARPKRSRTRLLRTLHTEEAASPSRRWQLRRADGLICTFEAMRDDLRGRGLMAPDRIVAIEGAVDSGIFSAGRVGLGRRHSPGGHGGSHEGGTRAPVAAQCMEAGGSQAARGSPFVGGSRRAGRISQA